MNGVCITSSSMDYTVYYNSYSILNINYPHVTHIRLPWMFMAVPLCPRTTLNIQGSSWHGHSLALAPRSLKSCYHGDMLPWRHPGKFQGCPRMVKPGWTSVWVCVLLTCGGSQLWYLFMLKAWNDNQMLIGLGNFLKHKYVIIAYRKLFNSKLRSRLSETKV